MPKFVQYCSYYADSFLILFYRMTGHALLDYYIGTTVLAFICVVVGELSISLALKFNKRHIDAMNAEMSAKEQLALAAYKEGNQAGYKALNHEATEAWSKQFFTMIAYSAGILWPIPFAFGWLQYRFADVAFPLAYPLSLLFGKTVGYTFTFIPLYILCRIVFKYLRPRLPYFKGIQKLLDEYGKQPSH